MSVSPHTFKKTSTFIGLLLDCIVSFKQHSKCWPALITVCTHSVS